MAQENSIAHPNISGRENRALIALVYFAVIFLTLALAIAYEALSRFGLETNYAVVFGVAFLLAVILLRRNVKVLALVLIGVVAINLPDETLLLYSVDRDILLAIVCAFILVPSTYELVLK